VTACASRAPAAWGASAPRARGCLGGRAALLGRWRRLGRLLGLGAPLLGGLALQRLGLGSRSLLDLARLVGVARSCLAQRLEAGALDQPELDAARFQIDTRHLHLHLVGKPVA